MILEGDKERGREKIIIGRRETKGCVLEKRGRRRRERREAREDNDKV